MTAGEGSFWPVPAGRKPSADQTARAQSMLVSTGVLVGGHRNSGQPSPVSALRRMI
jgi:hypothetical protein